MNWVRIDGSWEQFKSSLTQQWGRLADDQIALRLYTRDNGHATLGSYRFFINPKKDSK